MISKQSTRLSQSGVTLVEILVTVVVISVGLLGVAALHTYTLRSSQDALVHSQATILIQDIADRMRANRNAALAGAYDTSIGSSIAAPAPTAPISAKDLHEWKTHLAGVLTNGDGAVRRVNLTGSRTLFVIRVQWSERAVAQPGATPQVNTFESSVEI